MSEPIPDVPDVVAARALVALIELLHTDPLARPLLGSGTGLNCPWFYVFRGEVHFDLHMPDAGAEQVAAAQALFGGTFTLSEQGPRDAQKHAMRITWQDAPLQVTVEVGREDELAVLRKQTADQAAELAALRAAAGLVVAE